MDKEDDIIQMPMRKGKTAVANTNLTLFFGKFMM
jgi:hypothetical protein